MDPDHGVRVLLAVLPQARQLPRGIRAATEDDVLPHGHRLSPVRHVHSLVAQLRAQDGQHLLDRRRALEAVVDIGLQEDVLLVP